MGETGISNGFASSGEGRSSPKRQVRHHGLHRGSRKRVQKKKQPPRWPASRQASAAPRKTAFSGASRVEKGRAGGGDRGRERHSGPPFARGPASRRKKNSLAPPPGPEGSPPPREKPGRAPTPSTAKKAGMKARSARGWGEGPRQARHKKSPLAWGGPLKPVVAEKKRFEPGPPGRVGAQTSAMLSQQQDSRRGRGGEKKDTDRVGSLRGVSKEQAQRAPILMSLKLGGKVDRAGPLLDVLEPGADRVGKKNAAAAREKKGHRRSKKKSGTRSRHRGNRRAQAGRRQ